MSRPIWMQPVEYTEDRFDERASRQPEAIPQPPPPDEADEAFGVDDDDEFASLDNEPIDYTRGPHDEELGVDDDQSLDTDPVDYSRGPHEEEFGVDDEEEFDVDDEEEA